MNQNQNTTAQSFYGHPLPPDIDQETVEKWREIIKTAHRMEYGELVITIHQGKIDLTEYTVKKKPLQGKDFEITPLY